MKLTEQISWCKDQIKNGYEVVMIRSILSRLKSFEAPKEPPHPFHNKGVEIYMQFLESNGLPPIMEPRQGKALKELLYKLENYTASKTALGAFNALNFILSNWQRLNDYHKSKKTLSHINSNLVEILDIIRNGANKQQSNLNEAQRFHNELTQNQRNNNS